MAATAINYTSFINKNKIVIRKSTKKSTKFIFYYSLMEEKESVMGLEPVGEFLPSIWLKSWNNLVHGHRIYKTDGARYFKNKGYKDFRNDKLFSWLRCQQRIL